MELVTKRVLEYTPETVHMIRKLYGLEDPEKMNEAIENLDDWVKRQNHFKRKDFNRVYLESVIIASKGNLERAKSRLDKYCSMRTSMPKFFEKVDAKNEIKDTHTTFYMAFLPRFVDDFCRVALIKNTNINLRASTIYDFYRYGIMCAEYLRMNDYFNGIVIVVDYRDFNLLDLITKLRPFELTQVFKLFMEGFGVRVKGIHLLTPSRVIGVLVAIMKKVLSAKVGARIQVHKSIESLYEYVPREALPEEYGGREKSLLKLREDLLEAVSSKSHIQHLREMQQFGVVEANRRTERQNCNDNFESLCID